MFFIYWKKTLSSKHNLLIHIKNLITLFIGFCCFNILANEFIQQISLGDHACEMINDFGHGSVWLWNLENEVPDTLYITLQTEYAGTKVKLVTYNQNSWFPKATYLTVSKKNGIFIYTLPFNDKTKSKEIQLMVCKDNSEEHISIHLMHKDIHKHFQKLLDKHKLYRKVNGSNNEFGQPTFHFGNPTSHYSVLNIMFESHSELTSLKFDTNNLLKSTWHFFSDIMKQHGLINQLTKNGVSFGMLLDQEDGLLHILRIGFAQPYKTLSYEGRGEAEKLNSPDNLAIACHEISEGFIDKSADNITTVISAPWISGKKGQINNLCYAKKNNSLIITELSVPSLAYKLKCECPDDSNSEDYNELINKYNNHKHSTGIGLGLCCCRLTGRETANYPSGTISLMASPRSLDLNNLTYYPRSQITRGNAKQLFVIKSFTPCKLDSQYGNCWTMSPILTGCESTSDEIILTWEIPADQVEIFKRTAFIGLSFSPISFSFNGKTCTTEEFDFNTIYNGRLLVDYPLPETLTDWQKPIIQSEIEEESAIKQTIAQHKPGETVTFKTHMHWDDLVVLHERIQHPIKDITKGDWHVFLTLVGKDGISTSIGRAYELVTEHNEVTKYCYSQDNKLVLLKES